MTDFRPGLFTRALLAVAPEAGLKRMRAQLAALEVLRAYDGAKSDRRLGGWRASAASANTEAFGAMDTLRYRARDLERNNRVVFSAMQQFAGQVVGTGITPRAIHSSRRLTIKAMDAWKRFCDTCDPEGQQDYYGLQALTARTMFRDGECLHLWLPDRGIPNSQIRVLEADHLDQSRSATTSARNAMGIEFDSWRRRVGYWLFEIHPGENGWLPTQSNSKLYSADDVEHYFHVTRPGQVRGVSWLAPSIMALRGNDDIEEAVRWRKRLEACIGLILETPDSGGAMPAVGAQTKTTTGSGATRLEEQMTPGMMLRFGPGEKALAFNPSTGGDTVQYLKTQLQAFCATTGVAYHAISGDPSEANYSSLRALSLAGHVILDTVQWNVMAPREKRAFRRVMQREALLTGDRRFEEVGCELAMPIRPWVDPVKEISAKIFEIRAGLQSMPDALAERGIDWAQQLNEIEAFLKVLDEKKIILETDARQTTRAGQLQQIPNNSDQAPVSKN